jgi:hypothetical protein
MTPRNGAAGHFARMKIPPSSRFESPGLASPCLNSPLSATMSQHVALGAASRAMAARAMSNSAAADVKKASIKATFAAASAAPTVRPTLVNPNYQSSSEEEESGESDDEETDATPAKPAAAAAARRSARPFDASMLLMGKGKLKQKKARVAKKSFAHPIFGSKGVGQSGRKAKGLRKVERTATGTPINTRKKRCVPHHAVASGAFVC